MEGADLILLLYKKKKKGKKDPCNGLSYCTVFNFLAYINIEMGL